jgi:hypothetical protein
MANPVIHESKHIVKRILIGVATGVGGAVIIYFLGFNRSETKASEIEVKKNTIKTWKTFTEIENAASVEFDSSLAKANRKLTSFKYNEKYTEKDSIIKNFIKKDSLIFSAFISDLEELSQAKDIDAEFSILLGTRIAYLKEQFAYSAEYKTKFGAASTDPVTSPFEKSEKIEEMNKINNDRMSNLTERVGRSIEDLAISLSKKYDHPFLMSDFRFYPAYLNIRNAKKTLPILSEKAPADPNAADSGRSN